MSPQNLSVIFDPIANDEDTKSNMQTLRRSLRACKTQNSLM
ncbi:hypothetical protein [Nostoc sp. LPT]